MTALFTAMSDEKMAGLIAEARHRVIVAVPAVRDRAAKALCDAVPRLGAEFVGIVLDCDEEVFRLGYGSIEAIHLLRQAGCRIRQSSGLRIGALVCDNFAWVFSPTALYVQPETQSDETPNAIALKAADVERIVAGILPIRKRSVTESDSSIEVPPGILQEIERAPVEIGIIELEERLLKDTHASLELAPPLAFDVARQVRVFEAYIQYVEISLRGCAIQRHRLELPKSIQGIEGTDLDSRLHTNFELIEKSSKVSSSTLEKQLNKVRDDFTRPLGKPWGRVILRGARSKFDERMDQFRMKLEEHQATVKKELGDALKLSKQQLLDYYLPFIIKNPPDVLLGQISTQSLSEDQARQWLENQLSTVFPTPESLISEMKLDVQYRDVTFETLNEEGFAEKLKEAYPHVDWEKPFSEFDAAKARENEPAPRNHI